MAIKKLLLDAFLSALAQQYPNIFTSMAGKYNFIEVNAASSEDLMLQFYDYHARLQSTKGKQPKTLAAYIKRAWELVAMSLRYECVIEREGQIIGRIEIICFNTSPSEISVEISGELLCGCSVEGLLLFSYWNKCSSNTHRPLP
jgi:hypothetical protein